MSKRKKPVSDRRLSFFFPSKGMEEVETRQEEAGCPYNLLFAVFCARDESNGLHVSKVNVPSEDIHVQQLADIFLLVVATKAALYRNDSAKVRGQFSFSGLVAQRERGMSANVTLELCADVGHLFVNSLFLEFTDAT